MSGAVGIKKPVALIGANGMLARMIQKRAPEEFELFHFDLPDFDITDKLQVVRTLSVLKPRIIINCAAFTAVDVCEEQEELATQVNAAGVVNLVAVAQNFDATLVHVSTDYVFPGTLVRPYREHDQTGPISAYGRSKLKGEQAILDSGLEKYYIVRTSWLYGPDGPNFVETVLRLASEREELRIVDDQIGNPTFTGDLADAIFALIEANAAFGVYHFANEGQCTWYEFAQQIIALAKEANVSLKVRNLVPIKTFDYPLPAERPSYSVLDKGKYVAASGRSVPDWRDSLRRYFRQRNNEELS